MAQISSGQSSGRGAVPLDTLPVEYVASWHVFARYGAQRLARKLPAGRPLTILDVGVGGGMNSLICAMAGHRVLALDIRRPPLYLLAEMAFRTDTQDRIGPVRGDAMMLPVPGAHFDVVIASHIIEHLPDPRSFLVELARVLKPAGVLLLSMPSMPAPRRVYEAFGLDLNDPTHLVPGYAPQDIERLLPAALELAWFERSCGFLGTAIHDTHTLFGRLLDVKANPQQEGAAHAPHLDRRARLRRAAQWLLREGVVNALQVVLRIEDRLSRGRGWFLDCVIVKG